jgi:hypothetical protein
VGAVEVIEGFELTQGAQQVTLVPDQGAVEELAPGRSVPTAP